MKPKLPKEMKEAIKSLETLYRVLVTIEDTDLRNKAFDAVGFLLSCAHKQPSLTEFATLEKAGARLVFVCQNHHIKLAAAQS